MARIGCIELCDGKTCTDTSYKQVEHIWTLGSRCSHQLIYCGDSIGCVVKNCELNVINSKARERVLYHLSLGEKNI